MDAYSGQMTTGGFSKPRRRWWLPSARTFLVTVCVVSIMLIGIPMTTLAVRTLRVRRQRAAVGAIKELGGLVLSEEAETTVPPRLRRLLWDGFFFLKVHSVYMSGTGVTDAGLQHLKGAPHFERLWLNDTRVTDAGLEQIQELTDLRELDLNHTQVSDAGLEHLREMTRLRRLDLSCTHVTPAGVDELQKALPKCRIRH